MNKIAIAKSVAGVITSLGAGAVVGNAIKATTPENLKTANAILVGVGSFVIGGMVADAASDYVKKAIDEIATPANVIPMDPLEDPLI